MTRSTTKPAIVTVIREGRCIGTILSRGPAGFEGFDSCDRSLGVFETAAGANQAIHRSGAA